MIGIPSTMPFATQANPALNQAGQNTGNSSQQFTPIRSHAPSSPSGFSPNANQYDMVTESGVEVANPEHYGRETNLHSANTNTDNHPIQSATGQWVSSTTGQPWHGSYDSPGGQTQYYSNGHQVQDIGQIGIQLPQISVQQIQRNPAISSQVSGAVSANQTATGALSRSFSDYLSEAQKLGQQGAQQLQQSQAAINPDPTINRMNSDVTSASTGLGDTLNRYTNNQGQVQQDIAGENSNYKQTQDAALHKLQGDLATENNNYETAAQAVAGQAFARAGKANNLYHLTTGTPTSGSGQLDSRLMQAYADINIPLQQDLANRRLATTNQIYNLGAGLQNQYYGNDINQYQGQVLLNTDLANRANSNNQYITGLDQGTAQYIQTLKQQVATMQPQLAQQYLQSLGIPIQTAQAILSGNTSNLAQLAQLDQSANAYNFVSPYQSSAPGARLPQIQLPPSYGGGNYVGGGNNYGGATGGATASGTGDVNQWLSTPQGQAWMNQNNAAQNNYMNSPQVQQYLNPGTQVSPQAQATQAALLAGASMPVPGLW